MSKNLDGIVARIRDVRAQKRPETEKSLQKIDALIAALHKTRGRASAVAARYPDLAEALRGVSFDNAELALQKAHDINQAALDRLSRDCINIGVAGKSGQGKSQILRMLTGLGDAQIPTGGGGACTAVQSIVHNSNEQRAVIHFLTKSGLLEKKVFPSFAAKGSSPFALGISPRPDTLEQFLSMDLVSLLQKGDEEAAKSQAEENWDKVIALQTALKQDRGLISQLGAPPKQVGFDEVSSWLKKDNNETKHNVVDYVEMWTKFDDDLPIGLTVLDIPGLGDPTPGIEEDMLSNLKFKTDIVFFLRKPATDGSREMWWTEDHAAFDMIKSIYPANEVKPSDWVQLILNRDMRPEHWNEKTTELLQSSVPRGFTPAICDCGSKDAVRDMVDANIDRLVSQAEIIDNNRIAKAEAAFRSAIAEASALYNALRNASGDVIAQETGFPFRLLLKQFMADLRVPLKKDLPPAFRKEVAAVLDRHFKIATERFNDLYAKSENADVFPPELPVFSKKRLFIEFGAAHGGVGPVEIAVRNQREAVLKLLRNQLTECCDELVTRYFDCVVETGFKPNSALSRIGDTSVDNARARLENCLAAIRQSGSFSSLEEAMEGLLRFTLTFDTVILPAIYSIQELEDFNPERDVPKGDANEYADVKAYIDSLHDDQKRSEELYKWLHQKSESILSCITAGSTRSPLFQIAEHVANTMRANYDAFVFRFIWGDTTEDEWGRFADHNKAVFWKDEFDKAAANSQIAKDWQAALAGLAAAL